MQINIIKDNAIIFLMKWMNIYIIHLWKIVFNNTVSYKKKNEPKNEVAKCFSIPYLFIN